jgi:hypothetical protein
MKVGITGWIPVELILGETNSRDHRERRMKHLHECPRLSPGNPMSFDEGAAGVSDRNRASKQLN